MAPIRHLLSKIKKQFFAKEIGGKILAILTRKTQKKRT
jgi:hypothetical protein